MHWFCFSNGSFLNTTVWSFPNNGVKLPRKIFHRSTHLYISRTDAIVNVTDNN